MVVNTNENNKTIGAILLTKPGFKLWHLMLHSLAKLMVSTAFELERIISDKIEQA